MLKLSGVMPALVTPFDAKGQIDFKAFEAHLSPPEAAAPADTGQVPMPADTEKGNRALWWGLAAAIVLGLIYLLSR